MQVDRDLVSGAACHGRRVDVVAMQVGHQDRVHVTPPASDLRKRDSEPPLGRQPGVDQKRRPGVENECEVPGTSAAQRRDVESHGGTVPPSLTAGTS